MKKLLLSALCLLVSLLAMGESVNSKKALEIAANFLAKSGAPRRSPLMSRSICSVPTVRSLRRAPTLPTSRSVAVSYQPMEPPTCPMRSSSRVLPQVSIPFRFQTLRLTMVTTTWPVSASMPTSRVSLSTMAERC